MINLFLNRQPSSEPWECAAPANEKECRVLSSGGSTPFLLVALVCRARYSHSFYSAIPLLGRDLLDVVRFVVFLF